MTGDAIGKFKNVSDEDEDRARYQAIGESDRFLLKFKNPKT
jgi:hypothetical protein